MARSCETITIESFDPAICDLCGSESAVEIMSLAPPTMISDGTLLDKPLVKLACTSCGLVRSGLPIPARTLSEIYVSNYTTGARAAVAEPVYYVDAERKPRSAVLGDWIRGALAACRPGWSPQRILEIGCGEGRLLGRLGKIWPSADITGVEVNAENLANIQTAGLVARDNTSGLPSGGFDLVLSVAVIEHQPSPTAFLGEKRRLVADGGLVLCCQPCQDRPSHDIYFWDHLYQFRAAHITALGRKSGLREHHAESDHAIVPLFSLHVFEPAPAEATPASYTPVALDGQIARWNVIFSSVNGWLSECDGKALAVWGLGESFDLLCAYTELDRNDVVLGIDDNPEQAVMRHLPFPVITSDTFGSIQPLDALLVTFNAPNTVRKVARSVAQAVHFLE